jgi:hypothetical protein
MGADIWTGIWTLLWFAGLGIFSILSVLVIFFGGHDLAALLMSLRRRHGEAAAEEAVAQGTHQTPTP